MSNIQQIGCKSFIIQDVVISLASVNEILKKLYMEYDFDPTFLMLSSRVREDGSSDYAQFLDLVASGTNICIRSNVPEVIEERIRSYLSEYLNRYTGQIISLYANYHIPSSCVIFGSFAIDEIIC